jgi:enoyl-CoA hydratase
MITTHGAVGEIRLDRPDKRNALSKVTMLALADAVDELVGAGSRAIILAGSNTVFSAGADLSELSMTGADLEVEEGLHSAAGRLAGVPVPTIAAIEGPCLGAGVELAVACDIRVAGEGAYFMIPAARLGILYRPDGIDRLLRVLGPERTRRLLLLNDRLGSHEVVDIVVADGSALSRARELASRSLDLVPEAVAATKELIVELEVTGSASTKWDEVRRRLLADR